MAFLALDCQRRNTGVTAPARANVFLIALQLKEANDSRPNVQPTVIRRSTFVFQ